MSKSFGDEVRFKIEYLADVEQEDGVLHVRFSKATHVSDAEIEAWAGWRGVRETFAAAGFRIRDLAEGGRIVAVEAFETP